MRSNHIGDNINALRIDAGLSQVQFAKMAGTSQTTVSSWECGKSTPRQSNIERIMQALPYLTIDDILSNEAGFAKRSLKRAKNALCVAPLFRSVSADQSPETLPAEECIDLPESVSQRYPDAFFLTVNNESMNRCLPNGCYALINPTKSIDATADEKVFAVCVNGADATIRRIHLLHNGVELLPDSTDPTFEPQVLNFSKPGKTLRIIGEAVWFCSPLDFKL